MTDARGYIDMAWHLPRRALGAALLALALPAIAPAAAGDQPFPVASMHVEGQEQRGRLSEASFTQPAAKDLCVTQGGLGDGTFPRSLRIVKGPARLRFRVNAERRPDVSLRYWESVDRNGQAEGEPIEVPIDVKERKPNGSWQLVAELSLEGKRYLRLSAFWEGRGRCGAQEFLISHFAIRS